MIDYEVEETLSVIGESKGYEKRLCLIRWNGEPNPKLDLRVWKPDGENHKPGKGLTITDQEALILNAALTEYLQKKNL